MNSSTESPYPAPRKVDVSANTAWTQTVHARRSRAIAVSCMPQRLLGVFEAEISSGKRFGLMACNPQQQRAWRDIVAMLQMLGLLSPTTAAIDVDVPRMVREARRIIEAQKR